MRLRFSLVFWFGVLFFALGVGLTVWNVVHLREVIDLHKDALSMLQKLDDVQENLLAADVLILESNDQLTRERGRQFAHLVRLAYEDTIAISKISTDLENVDGQVSLLRDLIQSKVTFVEKITLAPDIYTGALFRKTLLLKNDRLVTQEVRRLIDEIDHNLTAQLHQHENFVDRYFGASVSAFVASVIISLFLFVFFARAVQAEIIRRSQLEVDLRQAQAAVLSGSNMKSHFLATVSHEIRTPLNGIIGMSELIREKSGGDLKRFAEVIYDSSRILLRLVNDILDFSKIEAGKIELEYQEILLSDLIDNAIDLFGNRANEKSVKVLSYYDPIFFSKVITDPARISQIIHNFVGNAVKFTDKGTITIVGELVRRSGVDFRLRISVQDTGPGISKKDIDKLFQPFHQLEIYHKHEGTGLGLSIAKNLAELLNGTVGVSSEEGVGSNFWFEFPIRVQAAAETPKVSKKIIILTTGMSAEVASILERLAGSYSLGFRLTDEAMVLLTTESDTVCLVSSSQVTDFEKLGKNVVIIPDSQSFRASKDVRVLNFPLSARRFLRDIDQVGEVQSASVERFDASQVSSKEKNHEVVILLVEDNITNQLLAQTQLEGLGYRVHIASDGQECLQVISQINYDVILMDCRMPILDGFETTRQIRSLELAGRLPHLPIIAMTAHALESDRQKCLVAGMDDYISKPFDLQKLHEMIQAWVLKSQSQIDWLVLNELSRNTNGDVVRRILKSYRQTLGDSLQVVKDSIGSKDGDKICNIAHQLKSSSAAIGAMALSEICSDIENNWRDRHHLDKEACEKIIFLGQKVLGELAAQTKYV